MEDEMEDEIVHEKLCCVSGRQTHKWYTKNFAFCNKKFLLNREQVIHWTLSHTYASHKTTNTID